VSAGSAAGAGVLVEPCSERYSFCVHPRRHGILSVTGRPDLTAASIALVFALALSPALGAQERPDLTGIWGNNPAEGRGGRGAFWPDDVPYTALGRAKVDRYHALVDPRGEIPGEFCVGRGMPASALASGGYPMEIIQRPEQVTIIYELYTEVRRIYTDGRVVDQRDLFATRNGFSTGVWEGDTLVVTTTNLKEAVDQASAHSAEATIVERYRLRADEGGRRVLGLELTLTDPAFYERPVTVTKTWAETKDGQMLLYECTEPEWEEHLEQLEKAAAQAPPEPVTHD
jgi:hypothetical protein